MIKFGTSGWRGIIADDFTFDNVKIVTQAIANYLINDDKEYKKDKRVRLVFKKYLTNILVLTTHPTFPGCIIRGRVLGYLELIDNGYTDEKVITVNDTDPRYDHIKTIEDLPEHTIDEIKEFFKTYKHLQGINVKVGNIYGLDKTIELIENCKKRFIENNQ